MKNVQEPGLEGSQNIHDVFCTWKDAQVPYHKSNAS